MKTKLLLLLFLTTTIGFAQKSPAMEVEGTIDEVSIEIKYSSPRVKGRTIYGELVPYGKIWRAGANKNTTIEFDKPVTLNGGQKLKAGKYGFFIVPNENGTWIAVFSNNNNSWGAYNYTENEDAIRFGVSTTTVEPIKENLAYSITNDDTIKFVWADKSFEMTVARTKK